VNQPQARWVIWFSLLIALFIYVLPLPFEWRWYRPEWPLLVLFYWGLALPHRVGIFSASLTGFALDMIHGTAVGAMAMGSVVAMLVILLNYQRIRQFDSILQSLTLGLLVSLALLVERWLHNLVGLGSPNLAFMSSVPLSMLLWPVIRNVLRAIRRYYEVE